LERRPTGKFAQRLVLLDVGQTFLSDGGGQTRTAGASLALRGGATGRSLRGDGPAEAVNLVPVPMSRSPSLVTRPVVSLKVQKAPSVVVPSRFRAAAAVNLPPASRVKAASKVVGPAGDSVPLPAITTWCVALRRFGQAWGARQRRFMVQPRRSSSGDGIVYLLPLPQRMARRTPAPSTPIRSASGEIVSVRPLLRRWRSGLVKFFRGGGIQ
jgi:hypothetical protein